MKTFIVMFMLVAVSLVAGGMYVKDNAMVMKCHDKKVLFVKYGVECKTVKRFG